MEGTVIINNCGTYRKVLKRELCVALFKAHAQNCTWMFDEEFKLLIHHLDHALQIQIYLTGVVRIFLKHGHFEERQSVFLDKLPDEMLDVLCGRLV